ncbi:dystrophin-like [Cydia fagiglandana]|uniref:dystrophin-like n=1 Tax=Cydia fagiglandana TaxID=1458189 RepID=UPI002FEE5781
MALTGFRKIENEAGYPCYIDEATGRQQNDHPEFCKIMESLEEYNGIKYSAYRIAFKVFALQRQLRVPALRISSGVFARHQLSLSETSLSLDTGELEAVLADIYFAAEKEGLFTGDVDLAVDLLINLLLNVYDKDRKEPIRVLAAKTLLIILSEESVSDKWAALANCCADHNGCVSPRRLAALLSNVAALPELLGDPCEQIQSDIDSCFDKSAGMLGAPARSVATWGASCARVTWLGVSARVRASRNSSCVSAACAKCQEPLIQVLKFKCSKCCDTYFCEKCYLYDKDLTTVSGHKNTHLVHEIIDGETKPQECLSFIKTMRRFFFCTKTRKKTKKKTTKKAISMTKEKETVKKERPAMFTSTVGKASGHVNNNPASMLQDIIVQLETQNKALEELSNQLQNTKEPEEGLRVKVDAHWSQISKQINRLKILKENLSSNTTLPTAEPEHPQAFDLFSPIPTLEQSDKRSKLSQAPRVLSLDSGNFSVMSKQQEPLVTVSGDALKPVMVHKSDSISTVSIKDISSWYNGSKLSQAPRVLSLDSGNFSVMSKQEPLVTVSGNALKPVKVHKSDSISTVSIKDISSWYNETEHASKQIADCTSQSISATEQKYAADIRSVETSNDKMKELNADLDTVLDRLQQILTNNFAMDESSFDNNQLRETANEMEGLLGTLIRGVEQRATLNATKGLV